MTEENSQQRPFFRDEIAGESDTIKHVLETVRKVSRSDASVLITGESGTGKELIARAIHINSDRRDGPMVVINCGAIPGELLESELFGHEKGAFTGAHRSRAGRFELADQGTVFLDEIGDMSPDLQVKLLRALQERRIERVGGIDSIPVDIRIISATNKDLPVAIDEGSFREDLFYRLNVIPVQVPPLRERITDLPLLIEHFQNKIHQRNRNHSVKCYNPEVIDALSLYHWPGNIRELENLVERLSVMVDESDITLADIPTHISSRESSMDMASAAAVFQKGISFNDAVDAYQKALICHALEETDWVKARAAELLKMNRTTLVEKIKKMNIEPEPELIFP